ncbi:L,D-transpeptidase [Jatrophihabitans endophyticus]|uniref:L,D-transpeptidase n=1 Tax=Jatrophihabitans endophyticus TaxID=1206085 RepID=UPI00190EEDDD|nr:Ig-like domain-containing protein [Jatrophihabitans endophyticus]
MLAASAAVAALAGLTACTSGGGTDSDSSPSAGASTSRGGATSSASGATGSAAASEASITTTAVGGATKANPAQPVTVKVADGTLESVVMTNPAGKVVTGSTSGDRSTWRTAEDLGYGKTYSIKATAKDEGGKVVVKRDKVTTLSPGNMTMPYFNTVNGTAMADGATYGVGMVTAVRFDEAIPDKDAAEKAVTVTTTPKVTGAWYWSDDQTMQWRPKNYYATGTKVTVAAKVYGVDLGNGLYGQSDKTTSFTVGQKHVTVADAKTHQVKVYFDDKLVRTMPTSMGKGGYIENGKISLWTMPGTYTVITHENPATMSSNTYGLPASSPYGYSGLIVPWATKISTDGIYLHELDSTVSVQGSQNVSHGCLNLNQSNAKWFYQHSRVGDPVTVKHSGGPKLQVWQGGQWSVPWSTWVKGGAK